MEYKLRIVEIMEQLDIANEVVLFSDVYEDKSDVSKVLVRSMFQYFQSKFDTRCEQMIEKERGDRSLLASAWYAICFEKGFTYNGKILLGLPWIIAEEMCKLAELSHRKLSKGSGTSDVEQGLPIGPFDSEDSDDSEEIDECNSIILDCQNKQLDNNTSMEHYYWNPEIIIDHMKMINIDQLIDIHHQFVVQTQIKVTLSLIMKWIGRIKRGIYQDRGDEEGKVELIQLTDQISSGLHDSSVTAFTEDEVLRAFIMVSLSSLNSTV